MLPIRRISIAALGGLIASIGVAWVSVFVVDGGILTRQQFVEDLLPIVGDHAVGIDPMVDLMSLCDAPIAIGAGYSGGRLERVGNGLSADGLFGACKARDDPSGYDFAEARGWPCLCVWYGERTSRTPPFTTETEGGIVIGQRTAGTRGIIGSGAKVLAYRPLPAGLALNTLLYGVAIFGAMEGWARLARRRRGSGRCARCGYSLAGLVSGARCPECGATAALPA
jgi:hypothetical protein